MDKNNTKWYTIAVVPGREILVQERIENEHKRKPINGLVEVFSPYELINTESEKGTKSKKVGLCSGYIFVELESTGGIMSIVRSIDGAIGLICDRNGKPVEVRRKEVERFMTKPSEKTVYKYKDLQLDEVLYVAEGAFEGLKGKFLEYVDTETKDEAIITLYIMNNPVNMTFKVSNLTRTLV